MKEDILISSKRLKRERTIRRYLKILAIPFLSALFLFVLANLSWFRIQDIEINGGEENKKAVRDLIKENLSKRIFLFFPADNIFLVNKDNLIREIKNKFPEIENATAITDFFSRKIKVDVNNRQIFAFTCREEKCFYLDEKGFFWKLSRAQPRHFAIFIKFLFLPEKLKKI